MQYKVNTSLWCSLSESGFSLDELVLKLQELFSSEGFSGMLKLLLDLVQERLIIESISTNKRTWCSCGKPHYVLNGSYPRKIKTSLGQIRQFWRRLKCSNCSHDCTPLKEFLGIEKHQYKSNELERLVIDAASKDSYRRAIESVGAQGFVRISHSTAHRWVMESDCDHLDFSSKVKDVDKPVQLVPDGTGFKGRPSDGNAKKGDLKVIIGVDSRGAVFPIGAWAGESWDAISGKVKKVIPKFPKDSILLADGETAITNAFIDMVDEQQRCHWHIPRDIYHNMWQNGATMKDSRPIQKALAGVLAVELPKEDFEAVSEQEKDDIEERMEQTEDLMDKLIEYLNEKTYTKAAAYLDNAKRAMFGYVRRWLKTGLICPRASSMIERVMRELGRRLKKISYNWSDKGCSKMARILLRKFTAKNEWDEYWKRKQRIDGNVIMGIIQIKELSQNL